MVLMGNDDGWLVASMQWSNGLQEGGGNLKQFFKLLKWYFKWVESAYILSLFFHLWQKRLKVFYTFILALITLKLRSSEISALMFVWCMWYMIFSENLTKSNLLTHPPIYCYLLFILLAILFAICYQLQSLQYKLILSFYARMRVLLSICVDLWQNDTHHHATIIIIIIIIIDYMLYFIDSIKSSVTPLAYWLNWPILCVCHIYAWW